jgi:2'-5' RNA ligase
MPRLFTAFPVPALRALHEQADAFRQADLRLRMESPERWHVTLNFLGDVADSEVGSLAGQLRKVTCGVGPVPIRLQGLGAFPDLRLPRVIWVGVESSHELTLLHARLGRVIEEMGVPSEPVFVPHVTLARMRHRPSQRLCSLLEEQSHSPFGVIVPKEVMLYESRPNAAGQQYHVLERFVLHGDSLGGRFPGENPAEQGS